MPVIQPADKVFLQKLTSAIEEHLSNEQFGVSALAAIIGMSRSNLLRRVKKLTGLSVSRYIRQIRLENAMELLEEGGYTVSEITFRVGFSSTSYFIKCFHDHYGYPPGEADKHKDESKNKYELKEKYTHQLAAIMFTDIQGYTALMQQDEQKGVAFRKRHREIFKPVTEQFNGKILQYYGDGTLSTFSSAYDAVRCGVALQKLFLKDPQIPVRIGIHTGDIIFTEDDIIGDGVNVASRVESFASAGSVFISEKVFDEVKNKPDIETKSMGLFELKNVDKPMEVFAIANEGLVVPDKKDISALGKGKKMEQDETAKQPDKKAPLKWAIILLLAVAVSWLLYKSEILSPPAHDPVQEVKITDKKSIAVLPFINDSRDSANIYIINGLMESILNNLQKVEDLRVISRTSVEKFRGSSKTIPEIARELNVYYFIEGSGQKIGDKILLNVQLIEAPTDKHLWAAQFNRQIEDIFDLQIELAKSITQNIQVIITPEEIRRIEKQPTDNVVAYDFFLKGNDLLLQQNEPALRKSIGYFEKAIAEDPEFARAYAALTMAYYYLDLYQEQKQYTDLIVENADQALYYDSQLEQSLIAKALSLMARKQFDQAVPYLEKALEYNPNSALVINYLSDFYANYSPDTRKYLEYALKGLRLDVGAQDSVTTSYSYLHVGNAFIQSGFVEEAEKYIKKSIAYDPTNIYSKYVLTYIRYVGDRNLEEARQDLLRILAIDTTRLDVLQEVAKLNYYLRDYKSAYGYYKKFDDIRNAYKLNIYPGEDAKIGYVFHHMGFHEEGDRLFADYLDFAEKDQSIYKNLSFSMYYAWKGDTEKALDYMELFSQEDNYQYWIVLFLEIDPLVDNLKELPRFKKLMHNMEVQFWEYHYQTKEYLEQEGLI